MAAAEWELIERYCKPMGGDADARRAAGVRLGMGDDAAVLRPPEASDLVVTVDTLVADVHFPWDAPAESVGHKALAVNVSDLAAMGADPKYWTLSLTLPHADETWLAAFSQGMGALAQRLGVLLVGGDINRGPTAISVQAMGSVARGAPLTRAGARSGDVICVTGPLGDAGLGLRVWQHGAPRLEPHLEAYVRDRLHRPEPRVAAGLALRPWASAAIDLSDGLWTDLQRVLQASGTGAEIELSALPVSSALERYLDPEARWRLALTAGDDYELCFCVPPASVAALESALHEVGQACYRIGRCTPTPELIGRRPDGERWSPEQHGYRHFGDAP